MEFIRSLGVARPPGADPQEDTLQTWRERIFNTVITFAAYAGFLVYIVNLFILIGQQDWESIAIYSVVYLWLLGSAFLKKIPVNYRAGSFVTLILILGVVTSQINATVGDGRVWLLLATVLAALFLGGRAGIVFSGLSFLTWLALGFLFSQRLIAYPYELLVGYIQVENFSTWFTTGLTTLIAGLTLTASIAITLNNLNTSLENSRSLTEGLEQQSQLLQKQAETLARHSEVLEASSHVSRAIASVLDTEIILEQTARLTREHFGLSHVGIFMLDDGKETATLAASDGGDGKTLPARGFSIVLAGDLIGWVITQQEARANHGNDEQTTPPLKIRLLSAQSQAAIPLRGRTGILGALALQSTAPQAFGPNTLAALQILADQIATFLENARLLEERESALESERRAYSQLTGSAWQAFARARSQISYRHDQGGFSSIDTARQPRPKSESQEAAQSVPIEIRGNIVGYIDAQKSANKAWSSSEQELLATLASRLETAMDSARLYEETQQRAAQERIIGEISSRFRETLDIETVLETAARELHEALGKVETEVWIGSDPSLSAD